MNMQMRTDILDAIERFDERHPDWEGDSPQEDPKWCLFQVLCDMAAHAAAESVNDLRDGDTITTAENAINAFQRDMQKAFAGKANFTWEFEVR